MALSAILLLSLMTGCRESLPPVTEPEDNPIIAEPEPAAYISPFGEVISESELNYLIRNPQLDVYSEAQTSGEFSEMRMTIEGLKDTALEDSINERIDLLHNEVKDMIPPYRGIRKIIPESAELIGSYISTSMNFSYYNLVSIRSSGSKTYSLGSPYEPVYLEYIETLNLDLNSGREVMLPDLFKSNVDYRTILNDLVKKILDKDFATDEYSEWFSNLNLISPFRGIRDDQKFLLSENALVLIIDYDTPEFDTKTYYAFINIPFGDIKDSLAIRERFYDENTSLYIKEENPVKSLITDFDRKVIGERINEEKGNVSIYSEFRYPVELDKDIVENFMEFAHIDQEEIDRLSENGSRKISFFQESSASSKGQYISFYKNRNISVIEGESIFLSELLTLSEDGEPLTLEELFTKDYDYASLIKSKMKEAVPPQLTITQKELDDLYSSLDFGLNATNIYFSTDPVQVTETETYPISFTIDYEEIGCENLMIFH